MLYWFLFSFPVCTLEEASLLFSETLISICKRHLFSASSSVQGYLLNIKIVLKKWWKHQNQPPEVGLNPVKHIMTVTGLGGRPGTNAKAKARFKRTSAIRTAALNAPQMTSFHPVCSLVHSETRCCWDPAAQLSEHNCTQWMQRQRKALILCWWGDNKSI